MDSVAVVLGKRMRKLRERKGLNQTELARMVLSSKTAISDYERGDRSPDADMIARLEVALDADGVLLEEHGLLELGEQDSATIADVEHDAIGLTLWESRSVTGLLQTPDYARASMSAVIPADKLDREVTIRLQRQKILDSLVFGWFVLDEAVLRRVVGTREVMNEQLLHLEQVATKPNIGVQVMPFEASGHPGFDGPLTVVEYRDKPSVSYREGRRSGRLSHDRDEVLRDIHVLDRIKTAALSVPSSVEMIRTIREASYEQ